MREEDGSKNLLWRREISCCCSMWVSGPETADLFGRSCSRCCNPIIWRLPILIWAVATIIWSLMTFWGPIYMWLLYMTHWGLILIALQSLLGTIVAIAALRGRLHDTNNRLPFYVKIYWILYNIAIPVACLVTVFYWALLQGSARQMKVSRDPMLDLSVHAINSAVMLLELVLSLNPSRLIHVYQPILFACVYLIFGVVYYEAGGVDPWGNHWIYPVIDWSKPNQAMVVVTVTGIYLGIMHVLIVIVASARDKINKLMCDTEGSITIGDCA